MSVTRKWKPVFLPDRVMSAIKTYAVVVVISALAAEEKLVVEATVTGRSVTLWSVHVEHTHDYYDVNDELTREDRDVIRAAVIQAHLKGSRS